jgi:G3E family GTPase
LEVALFWKGLHSTRNSVLITPISAPVLIRVVHTILRAGFLGSGKTTLLRHILTAQHGRRICVIENEYGEDIGVEALVAKDGIGGEAVEDFFELSNGCLCCTVRDDLVETLERVLARRDRYDYILIETTGMANPGPVATAFWQDDALESAMQLDGIVTLCDCRLLQKQLDRPRADGGVNEAAAQIAHADVVLLNKTDLAGSDDSVVDATEARIRELNSSCTVHRCAHAAVDLDQILDIGAFDPATITEQLHPPRKPGGPAAGCAESTREGAGTGHHTHDDGHRHEHGRSGDDEVQTVLVECSGFVDERRLTRWIGSLLWEDEGAPVRERGTMLAAVAGREDSDREQHDPAARAEAAPGKDDADDDNDNDDDDDEVPPELEAALPADVDAVTAGIALAAPVSSLGAASKTADGKPMEILRCKGVLAVAAVRGSALEPAPHQCKHVLQGVEDVFEVRATTHAWGTAEPLRCRVLFIGRHLQQQALQAGLDSCVAIATE